MRPRQRSRRGKPKKKGALGLADLLGDDRALDFLWALRGQALGVAYSQNTPPAADDVARHRLAVAGAAYRAEQNPIHAWLAWTICRRTGIDAPEWVATYLDRVAGEIEALALRPPKNQGSALLIALELMRPGRDGKPGPGTAFTRFQRIDEMLNVVNLLQFLNEGRKLTGAAEDLEKLEKLGRDLLGIDLTPHLDAFMKPPRATRKNESPDLQRQRDSEDRKVLLEKIAADRAASPPSAITTSSRSKILASYRKYRRS